MHLAEFADDSGLNIISPSILRRALENPPRFVPGPTVAFCDFAPGGDQDVIALRRGNRVSWVPEVTLPRPCREP